MKCPSKIRARQWLNSGTIDLECHLEEGHEGQHEAFGQPFPGFANEHILWHDSETTQEQSMGAMGKFEDALKKEAQE